LANRFANEIIEIFDMPQKMAIDILIAFPAALQFLTKYVPQTA